MLFNNDEPNESQHKVFFAFANKVKENWEILNSSYENLKEIEIEYEPSEKGNKVVNIIDYTVSI
jgi:hypothetical protein